MSLGLNRARGGGRGYLQRFNELRMASLMELLRLLRVGGIAYVQTRRVALFSSMGGEKNHVPMSFRQLARV